MPEKPTKAALLEENRRLRTKLDELEATLHTSHGDIAIDTSVDSRDMPQRQHNDLTLSESEIRYRRLFEAAQDGILILDAESGKITDANPFILDLLSFSLSECLGKELWEIGLFADIATSKAAFRELQRKGYIRYEDLPLETKAGRKADVEFVSNVYEAGDRKVIQCNIRDITQRKQAEQNLQDEKMLTDILIESIPDIFFLLDQQGGLLRWNRRLEELFGLLPEEMPGTNALAYVHDEDRPYVAEKLQQAFETGSASTEARMNLTNGIRHYVLTGTRIETRLGVNVIGIGLDITERKQTDEAIQSSRDLLRSVMENVPLRIFWKDKELRYLGCNTAFAQDAGLKHPKELYGKDDFQMGWKDQAELYQADDRAVIQSGKLKLGFEELQTIPDGQTIWLRTSKVPLRDTKGEITGLIGIYEDITEEKQAQESLRRLNRALKTLSAINHALVHSQSEEELWQSVCRIIVEEGGYLLAWVGYAQQDDTKSVKVMASHAVKPGYTKNIHISWADVPEGRGPTGMAVRTGRTQYIQDIAIDPAMAPWREKALAYGYRASNALPLLENGNPFGAIIIYAAEPDAFNADEIALLEEMAEDLSYGISALRTRAEHEQHAMILQQSLEQSIQTIADTVEARDPYTAGHQRRVSELATAIAQEMGLPEEQIHGIHLAGIIHDLGKIHTPMEILAKPGRLNEVEYMLIQAHAQDGYDILKNVRFPWPIADIIRQHHERLDGSGYPQGLKDEEILLESKIMAVADVVEAMSSHRPYRAGMGLDRALAEIERGRGMQYDPNAVDACIKLFRERGYSITD